MQLVHERARQCHASESFSAYNGLTHARFNLYADLLTSHSSEYDCICVKTECLERNFRQNEVLILTGPTHTDVFKKRKFSPLDRRHTHCAQKMDFGRALMWWSSARETLGGTKPEDASIWDFYPPVLRTLNYSRCVIVPL